ncbi:MAG: cytochrome c [Proteobacteria bacterium]|nr:cytochrome c [Pseudomonadota bacterium]MBU1710289.1 cytochrome c [Pseudomonadota bacterium]
MKKTVITAILIVLSICLLSAGMASAKGDERKGKYFFRKNCRECHKPDGSAAELGPDSKTMKQWQRVFEKDKYMGLKCNAEWQKQSDQELEDVLSYLYNHAYDSPSPAKCK